jgi:hypothetical protein
VTPSPASSPGSDFIRRAVTKLWRKLLDEGRSPQTETFRVEYGSHDFAVYHWHDVFGLRRFKRAEAHFTSRLLI